jgi:hypothetical protein
MMHKNRREFLKLLASGGAAAVAGPFAASQPARRFIIDAHQHYQSASAAPDYVERLVKVYRPRNAMACVLTPMAGFET